MIVKKMVALYVQNQLVEKRRNESGNWINYIGCNYIFSRGPYTYKSNVHTSNFNNNDSLWNYAISKKVIHSK